MKITIKDKELELHYSMRIYLFYENIMGKSLDPSMLSTYTSLVILYYSAIMATMQYNHMNMDLSYDEFMNWLDDGGGNTIPEFAEWFIKQVEVSNSLAAEKKDEAKNEPKGKKTKNS